MNGSGAHGPQQGQDAAWLAAALRDQADEHEADLARIEAQFERLTRDEPHPAESQPVEARRPPRPLRPLRPGRLRVRLIGIPLGALVALATATIAVGVTLGIREQPAHPASQAAVSASPNHTAAGHQPPSTPTLRPAGSASSRSESGPTASSAPGPVTAAGTVDSHSTQFWAQEDLSVTATHTIKALHVIVTVSGGATVQSTGSWSTILSPQLDTAVSQTSTGLRYDFTLKPGQTLQPGTYGFGFQFNRPAGGHSFSLDTYAVTATTVEGSLQASASGNFAG